MTITRFSFPTTIHFGAGARKLVAQHLLEAGISLRTIQAVLGHKSLRTTEIYMHVTQPGIERLHETLDRLMADL